MNLNCDFHYHPRQYIKECIDYYRFAPAESPAQVEFGNRYTIQEHDIENKIYLGEGIDVDVCVWDDVRLFPQPMHFAHALCNIIWKNNDVSRRTDYILHSFMNNCSPIMEIEKSKIRLLFSIYDDHLRQVGVVTENDRLKHAVKVLHTLKNISKRLKKSEEQIFL